MAAPLCLQFPGRRFFGKEGFHASSTAHTGKGAGPRHLPTQHALPPCMACLWEAGIPSRREAPPSCWKERGEDIMASPSIFLPPISISSLTHSIAAPFLTFSEGGWGEGEKEGRKEPAGSERTGFGVKTSPNIHVTPSRTLPLHRAFLRDFSDMALRRGGEAGLVWGRVGIFSLLSLSLRILQEVLSFPRLHGL